MDYLPEYSLAPILKSHVAKGMERQLMNSQNLASFAAEAFEKTPQAK